MARPKTYTFPATASTAISAAQTSTGTALVLNGSLISGANPTVILEGIERTVTFTGTGADLSGVTFTVSGIGLNGNAFATVVTGPTGTTVVASANYFHQINSVTPSASISTSLISVGTGPNGRTNWYGTSNWVPGGLTTISLAMTTTAGAVTVQDCQEASPSATSATVFNHPVIAAATQAMHSNYAFPPRYIRATATGFTGSFGFTIIQGG